jgi:hypothetical protein
MEEVADDGCKAGSIFAVRSQAFDVLETEA